jgi:hypothetical protein
MAQHHDAAHASPDDQYLNTTEGSGHEHTDANVWMIVQFAIWLVASAVVTHVAMWLMFVWFVDSRTPAANATVEFPLAVGQEPRLPAGPRLQRFPANEILEFRTTENAELNGYGWIDRNAGTVRIPISEAMRLTVERGLPSRTQAAPPADGTQRADAPGTMPSDSSAGRAMERRR